MDALSYFLENNNYLSLFLPQTMVESLKRDDYQKGFILVILDLFLVDIFWAMPK